MAFWVFLRFSYIEFLLYWLFWAFVFCWSSLVFVRPLFAGSLCRDGVGGGLLIDSSNRVSPVLGLLLFSGVL